MFLAGFPSGFIDYDARRRNAAISNDPFCAITAMENIKTDLSALEVLEKNLAIRLKGSPEGEDPGIESSSSFKRELQYLQAHTIHHFALIALTLRLNGVDTESDFGMAPSTLQHSKQFS